LAKPLHGLPTVAYGLAFAHAVALDWLPPARDVWLRALMAELERLANRRVLTVYSPWLPPSPAGNQLP